MNKLLVLVLFSSSFAFAYEIYDANSGGTIYVKWCDPLKDGINDLEYIRCGDPTDTKVRIRGSCSNLQSDCGQLSPQYPIQTGDSKSRDFIKAKKQWEYFNLEQAAKVGYPASYKPASIDTTPGDKENAKRESPHKMGEAIEKPPGSR
jgi:hypothetical protein